MANYFYFLFLLGTFLSGTFILYKFKIKINPKSFLFSFLIIGLPFITWDAWAVRAGHWSFNEKFISGIFIGNLALEEVLFFLIVPFTMLAIFLCLKNSKKFEEKRPSEKLKKAPIIFLLVSALKTVFLLIISSFSGYTAVVALAFFAVSLTLFMCYKNLLKSKLFWQFQAVLLTLFFIANSFLTALPIIEYGSEYILGIKIGTIPIEDFFYNFALINAFILTYRSFSIFQK